jgi:hypothetical protein
VKDHGNCAGKLFSSTQSGNRKQLMLPDR